MGGHEDCPTHETAIACAEEHIPLAQSLFFGCGLVCPQGDEVTDLAVLSHRMAMESVYEQGLSEWNVCQDIEVTHFARLTFAIFFDGYGC